MGDHKVAMGINLEPTLIPEKADHASHRYACGAQGARHFLMGQTKIQAQSFITGLTVILSQQFKKPRTVLQRGVSQEARADIPIACSAEQQHREVLWPDLTIRQLPPSSRKGDHNP
jgi:hypothetical protein